MLRSFYSTYAQNRYRQEGERERQVDRRIVVGKSVEDEACCSAITRQVTAVPCVHPSIFPLGPHPRTLLMRTRSCEVNKMVGVSDVQHMRSLHLESRHEQQAIKSAV